MEMLAFGALNYAILGIYLAAMFTVGLMLAGKQKTTEDYFLAGRNMPWWVVAMSMFASLTSAISYMGVPGNAYGTNISYIIGAAVSPLVAPFLIFLFYPFYRRLSVTTSYEYVAVRFGLAARLAVSTLFVLARLGWLGTVIFAPALALSTVTGISLSVAIVLMATLATAYTALGGLSAVLWTDLIQFIILVGGAIWVAVSVIQQVPGGIGGIMKIADEAGRLDVFHLDVSLYTMAVPIAALSLFLSLMQDYGADQVTVQRLMAVKSSRGVTKAILVNAFTDFFMISLLLFIGLGILAYYTTHPSAEAAAMKADRMLPFYIVSVLPAGVSGLVISGIFAAAMSSMDSGINSLSTVIVNDFVKPFAPHRSDRQNMNLARILTVALGAFAMGVAFVVSGIEEILGASNTFLGMFAGPILALFLLGMLTRRGNFAGWLVGTVVSIALTAWISFGPIPQGEQRIHFIYYYPISFFTCFGIAYFASLVTGMKKAASKFTVWGRSELKQVVLPAWPEDPPSAP